MATLGVVVSLQKEMSSTVRWLTVLINVEGGDRFIYQVPIASICSMYVVSRFPSMHFWCLFTTYLFFPSTHSAYLQRLCISPLWFLILVLNFLLISVIAIVFLVVRFLDRYESIVGIFSVA